MRFLEKGEDAWSDLYKSRATILDKPSWADDEFIFHVVDPLDEFQIQIVAV